MSKPSTNLKDGALCDPARTFLTGGQTGSSPGPKTKTPKTAPSVFQCREWIPEEPLDARLLRALREAGGPMILSELCQACGTTENTVGVHLKPHVEAGTVEAGFIKLQCGKAQRMNRAYRIRGNP